MVTLFVCVLRRTGAFSGCVARACTGKAKSRSLTPLAKCASGFGMTLFGGGERIHKTKAARDGPRPLQRKESHPCQNQTRKDGPPDPGGNGSARYGIDLDTETGRIIGLS